MKMVEKWWKAWSAQLLMLAVVVSELSLYLPEIQQALPSDWYQWAFRAILIARIIKQRVPAQ